MKVSLFLFFLFIFLSNAIFFDPIDQQTHRSSLHNHNHEFSASRPRISSDNLEPLVLVPGLGASALEAKLHNAPEKYWTCRHNKDWFWLWMNVQDLIPYLTLPCFYYNLRVLYNTSTGDLTSNEGVTIRPRDYGGTGGIEYLNPLLKDLSQVLMKMVKFFVDVGYEKGKSLRGAPYDFRMSPQMWEKDGTFQSLKELIEETYEINNCEGTTRKVHVAGHSMGGPHLQHFLSTYVDQKWKDKYIGNFFSLLGSYDGSVMALPTMIYGHFYTFPVTLYQVIDHFGGLLWSIPNHIYLDDVFFITDERNYTIREVPEIFEDIGRPELAQLFQSVKTADVTLAPGVKTHCFRGMGVKTPKVVYMPKLEWGKKYGVIEYMEGDGQLLPPSEGICSSWANKQSQPVEQHIYNNGYDHRSYVQDPVVMEKMYDIMYNKN